MFAIKVDFLSQERWRVPLIPALQRQGQADLCESEDSQSSWETLSGNWVGGGGEKWIFCSCSNFFKTVIPGSMVKLHGHLSLIRDGLLCFCFGLLAKKQEEGRLRMGRSQHGWSCNLAVL